VAYNGYDNPPGALYLQLNNSLTLLRSNFVQQRTSRLTYHISFGQPF
jgi:hypothetical protein